MGPKWYYLGIELLKSDDVKKLNIIQFTHQTDPDICCTKLFQLWLDTQPEASWNQLIKSLRQPGVVLGHLATKIEQMLSQPAPGPAGKISFHLSIVIIKSIRSDKAGMVLISKAFTRIFSIKF